jgi:hypothetical protein
MTAATQRMPTRQPLPSQGFRSISETDLLSTELAKMLKLVAPAAMSADQQAMWLASAVEALEGIRAGEVQHVAAEIKRSITHHAKIVPEIARLVDDRRKRSARNSAEPVNSNALAEMLITEEAQKRRGRARNQDEVEAAWKWERDERLRAGLHVPPLEKPLTTAEIHALDAATVKLGLSVGALVQLSDGEIVDSLA